MGKDEDKETARLEELRLVDVKCNTLKTQYSRFLLMIGSNATTPLEIETIGIIIDSLRNIQDEFAIQETTVNGVVKGTSEVTKYKNYFDDMHLKVITSLGAAINLKNKHDLKLQQAQQSRQQANAIPTHDLKLPKFNIPPFDGDSTLWSSFIDQFNATVHTNLQLADVQKLQFLQSLMRGSAHALVSGFQLTGQNYKIAYDLLTDRFSNPRQIVTAHLNRFLALPVMTQENIDDLIKLSDVTAEVIQSLKVLGVPVNHWDAILIHLLVNKLDNSTRKEWEFSLKGDTAVQELKTFNSFILQKIRALETCVISNQQSHNNQQSTTNNNQQQQQQTPNNNQQQQTNNNQQQQQTTNNNQQSSRNSSPRKCQYCEETHPIWRCDKFTALSIPQRRNAINQRRRCINCFGLGHSVDQCYNKSCAQCHDRHHTLLHIDPKPVNTPNPSSHNSTTAPQQSTSDKPHGFNVLLYTAVVDAQDSNGIQQQARVLLDSGSQVNLITEDCVKHLKLKSEASDIKIVGIGNEGSYTKGLVTVNIASRHSLWKKPIQCYVLPKVTSDQPQQYYEKDEWPHLKTLNLADADFNRPHPIDILLGASTFNEILTPGKTEGPPGTPQAIATKLGWVISGEASPRKPHSIQCLSTTVQLNPTRTWSQENGPVFDSSPHQRLRWTTTADFPSRG